MATRIVVPDAGQTTDEMLLVRWHVRVGDSVQVGDILADIETDKAVAELEAYATGTVLRLLAEEGDTVITGQTLLWLGEPGEEIAEGPGGSGAETEMPVRAGSEPVGAAAAPSDHPLATPAARTLARERGLALGGLSGSGPDGCIVKRDVTASQPSTEAGDGSGLRGTSRPLSAMRQALATRLQASVREAPQFSVAIDVDMTQALLARQQAKATITDVIAKAVADTLAEHPRLNCRLEGDAVHYPVDINIGLAVSVEDGLVVPVLTEADQLSLAEVAQRTRALIENARAGRLAAGPRATFTISNLGMFGVKSFTAIVNPPEAAILAVGAIEDKVVLRGSDVTAVPTLTLTLSCDHRLVDGAPAARFLKALKARLEGDATAHETL